MSEWTEWMPFPNPLKNGFLIAPFGPGVYDLRNKQTDDLVLFGIGENCAYRMSSLLPEPLGCGTRNNAKKREYVLEHLEHIEYRCLPCEDIGTAEEEERKLRNNNDYLFST